MPTAYNTSLKNVAVNYLRLLQVKVCETSAKQDIESNPHYPSLLSLSETFNRYKIENNAFTVPAENIVKLKPPFVAYINVRGTGKDFVLVTGNTGPKINFIHKGSKKHSIALQEFLKNYLNVIWLAEPDNNSGEADYSDKKKKELRVTTGKWSWYAAVVLFLCFIFSFNQNTESRVAYYVITVLKLLGTAVAILLLIYENDKGNSFVKTLCSAGEHTNCDAVLSSRAAKILGISWGEIGFFYFAATLLLLLFPAISFGEKIGWLALANIITVPYIGFSVYYQWQIVKQWCPLCLAVQVILLSEFLWSVVNFWLAGVYPIGFFAKWPQIISCLLAPVIAWYGIKPLLQEARLADIYAAAYKRLQHNPEIFWAFLIKQPKAPEGWHHIGIDIGNEHAENTILKVCNPFCGPCARAHPELEQIIDNNPNVRLKIVFTCRYSKIDPGSVVVRHLLAIAAEGDSEKTKIAIDHWYNAVRKDYVSFARKFPIKQPEEMYTEKMEAMRKWCEEAEIIFTPTIYINGSKMPENYNISELKNIF